MKHKEKIYLICKWVAIAFLLSVAFNSAQYSASEFYKIKEMESKSGQIFIKVTNKTNKDIYCIVTGEGYWKDFTVYAKRESRPHIKPLKDFKCVCR